ncbi:unnamed protein product [Closterium sp. NIES-65]|nr:unnamed protein product [Closterium sp. NIES-65]
MAQPQQWQQQQQQQQHPQPELHQQLQLMQQQEQMQQYQKAPLIQSLPLITPFQSTQIPPRSLSLPPIPPAAITSTAVAAAAAATHIAAGVAAGSSAAAGTAAYNAVGLAVLTPLVSPTTIFHSPARLPRSNHPEQGEFKATDDAASGRATIDSTVNGGAGSSSGDVLMQEVTAAGSGAVYIGGGADHSIVEHSNHNTTAGLDLSLPDRAAGWLFLEAQDTHPTADAAGNLVTPFSCLPQRTAAAAGGDLATTPFSRIDRTACFSCENYGCSVPFMELLRGAGEGLEAGREAVDAAGSAYAADEQHLGDTAAGGGIYTVDPLEMFFLNDGEPRD